MITLVTGSPGAGKTLWTVSQIVEKLIPTGRRIVVNINGFQHPADNVHVVDHHDDMPFRWFEEPDGTIFVFDEIQRQYPNRHSTAKVPRYISEYETHRHRGFDFYFVTQHPRLIDRHLWPLTEEHVHLFRAFGAKRSRLYKWGAVNDEPQPRQSHSMANNTGFAFPKKYFGFYKSASLHTDKLRLPWKIIGILGLSVLGLGGAVAFVANWFTSKKNSAEHPHNEEQNSFNAHSCAYRLIGSMSDKLLVQAKGRVYLVDPSDYSAETVRLDENTACKRS